jgi:hypothetical protein
MQYKIVKIVHLISFIFDNIFSLTFYNKFDETSQFFPCKIAYCVKRQDFFEKTAFYSLDTEPEPEP